MRLLDDLHRASSVQLILSSDAGTVSLFVPSAFYLSMGGNINGIKLVRDQHEVISLGLTWEPTKLGIRLRVHDDQAPAGIDGPAGWAHTLDTATLRGLL